MKTSIPKIDTPSALSLISTACIVVVLSCIIRFSDTKYAVVHIYEKISDASEAGVHTASTAPVHATSPTSLLSGVLTLLVWSAIGLVFYLLLHAAYKVFVWPLERDSLEVGYVNMQRSQVTKRRVLRSAAIAAMLILCLFMFMLCRVLVVVRLPDLIYTPSIRTGALYVIQLIVAVAMTIPIRLCARIIRRSM